MMMNMMTAGHPKIINMPGFKIGDLQGKLFKRRSHIAASLGMTYDDEYVDSRAPQNYQSTRL